MMQHNQALPGRQIHLDFHTSPHISDLLVDFDAEMFAETCVRAHVNSVTVFAKCHHGMSYYPTRVGIEHPHLGGRDLLGEQIEVLHARGIRAPIYYTVGWEEHLASYRPEWRQFKPDGTFADQETASDNRTEQPGRWKFMCFNTPAYVEHMCAQLEELAARYPVDGLFLDIAFFHKDACFCDHCRKFRQQQGLREHTPANHHRFQQLVRLRFAERISGLLHARHPYATIFFNSGHRFSVDANTGLRSMNAHQTHWEIESLPSGFWGYYHFPRFARHVETFGRRWIGMTGRFQRMWGDFGGLKPRAALEFECFRTQAHGGGNSVGDQLPPRGRLDQAAYDLIGTVYARVADAEPFYAESRAIADVGVLLASHPDVDVRAAFLAEEGAMLMLEEAHYSPLVLDDAVELDDFVALVLPDWTVITDRLYGTLRRYFEQGGRIVLSHRAGRDAAGDWRLDFLPLEMHGAEEMSPTYWRAAETFWPGESTSDRVFYDAGMRVTGGPGTEVLIERVFPYFKRTDTHYMSHFHAPPVRDAQHYPAVIAGERFVYFADPVFSTYRRYGSTIYRDVVERVLSRLVGPPLAGNGLPRTILVLPRRRGADLIITLLHYVPIRKALGIDIIEEASSFAGEVLRVRSLREEMSPCCFRGGRLDDEAAGGYALPAAKGRLLIEVPGYFEDEKVVVVD